jgi:hypothetical protein
MPPCSFGDGGACRLDAASRRPPLALADVFAVRALAFAAWWALTFERVAFVVVAVLVCTFDEA